MYQIWGLVSYGCGDPIAYSRLLLVEKYQGIFLMKESFYEGIFWMKEYEAGKSLGLTFIFIISAEFFGPLIHFGPFLFHHVDKSLAESITFLAVS